MEFLEAAGNGDPGATVDELRHFVEGSAQQFFEEGFAVGTLALHRLLEAGFDMGPQGVERGRVNVWL